MKEFDVTITETLKLTVSVEASSKEEAQQMVSDQWHAGDHILDADNFVEVEFESNDGREISVERAQDDTLEVLMVEPGQYPRVERIGSDLASLQKAVDGYIEAIYPYDDPVALICGEEANLEGKYAGLYEDDFLKEVIGHSRQAEETERRLKEKELKSLLARDDELDGLFERIYEDNVSGKLSDDRFAKMSRRYEEEQKELSEKIKKLRSEIEKQSSRATSTDMFVSIVRKYTRARKLTPRMLNELVEKIEVYNAEKIDGEWVQRLRIHYNCVGEMNIPNEPALPIPAVTVNTRKGVFVSYTTDDRPAV